MTFVLDMQLGNLLRFVVLIFSPLPVSVKTVQSIFIQYKSEQMQPGFFLFFFFFFWRVLLSGKDLVLRKGWQIAFDKVLMSLCWSVTYINSLVTRIKLIASLWAQQWKKGLQCLFFYMYIITGSIHIYRNSSVKVYRNCCHCHVIPNSFNFSFFCGTQNVHFWWWLQKLCKYKWSSPVLYYIFPRAFQCC